MDGQIIKSQRAKVLVQALPYIQKYWNRVVVIKYGGHAMESEELKRQVMEDIVLLQLVGVKVVLVLSLIHIWTPSATAAPARATTR